MVSGGVFSIGRGKWFLCAPFFRCADGLQPQSPGEQHIEVIDQSSSREALALPPQVDHIASGKTMGNHGKPMECSKSMENMSEKKHEKTKTRVCCNITPISEQMVIESNNYTTLWFCCYRSINQMFNRT